MISAGPIAGLLGTPNLILAQAVAPRRRRRADRRDQPLGHRSATTHRPRLRRRRAPGRLRLRSPFAADAADRRRLHRLRGPVLLGELPVPHGDEAAFPTDVELATALGVLSATTTAVSFLVAVAFANGPTRGSGSPRSRSLLPLVYLAGFGVWLVRFSLATAVGFRFAQQVTQRGLSNASGAPSTTSSRAPAGPGAGVHGRRPRPGRHRPGRPAPPGRQAALPSQTPIFLLGIAAAASSASLLVLADPADLRGEPRRRRSAPVWASSCSRAGRVW